MSDKPFHWRCDQQLGPRVGAGYLQALLSGDEALLVDYRLAFNADELLTALSAPIELLARYLGYHVNRTPTEIGDALLRATAMTTKEPLA